MSANTLKKLLNGTKLLDSAGDLSIPVSGIQFDSRKVQEGDVFVAIQGTQVDGHQYVEQAIEQGAAAVVIQKGADSLKERSITWVLLEDTGRALGNMASIFYGEPSKKLKLVGITGTNGKTTTVTLLHRLFMEMGAVVGMISTIENKIEETVLPTKFTTPDALTLNKLLAEMLQAGCEFVFMEVSSHALVQGRVAGIAFSGAIFSNITHDHLDYHGTFPEYIKAKKLLFDHLPKKAFALINKDDKRGAVMLQNCKAATQRYYALHTMADFHGKVVENTFDGLHLSIDGKDAWFRLVGEFNASNLLAVYATACLLGENEDKILRHLSRIGAARGRFEQIRLKNEVRAVVDYAHTPDALKNVLETLQQIRETGERIITVVGCGGNRDATKRPIMAATAGNLSEVVVLTSDNPRFEDPKAILDEMKEGLSIEQRAKSRTLVDRKEGIEKAVSLANPGDIVLVAGKGHETYQEIEGVRHHFDDMEILQQFVEEKKQDFATNKVV